MNPSSKPRVSKPVQKGTTLDEQLKVWLEHCAHKQRVLRFRGLMVDLQGKVSTGGRKFTRDEMTER